MNHLTDILQCLTSTIAIGKTAIDLVTWLRQHLKSVHKNAKTTEVMTYLKNIGCVSEADVRRLVENWDAPPQVKDEEREQLTTLLINLTRGARLHTTCGTPLSSYVRCSRLLDQLLNNIQPTRKLGETVGLGWGDWKLEKFLGIGAFGEVWMGKSGLYPNPYAFKFFTSDASRGWLEREQQTLFSVKECLEDCLNIIRFENIVVAEQEFPFLVLEYVGGGSLEDWIVAHAEDRFSVDKAEIMEGIARGLACAHSEQIYHRDLKPANILLTNDSPVQAKIADFGLGVVSRNGSSASSQTSQGVIVGTHMYLPPEAMEPCETHQWPQDDVFAFGVIWYQLLSERLERPPYDFADVLADRRIDSRTIRLISRCLAQPDRRFKNACELLEELERESASAAWAIPDDCYNVGELVSEYLNEL